VSIRAATETRNLGRYHVVKRLAKGGMADVLLARSIGVAGFERHVVIKRIHPELGDEPRYRKMFLDEARLAASLHHHNIVQVNDIGEQSGEYFFAMEYVHGEDARTLLIEANKRNQMIPTEHVITIAMAAAAGLHHAHEQKGPDKRPLHIVHRDVSPANILVGYDGGVKVADFGIAFAANRAEQTQSGVLKGKASYMSPEQCNCEPVDRRSDVFSLGIVLYELATVHPCFKGDNDFHTMSAIVNGRFTRPSTLNAMIHPDLEAIIMKALAAKPADRYATCDEMRIALDKFADAQNLRTSTTALADYMKQQFGTRPEPWLEEATPDEAEIEITGSSPLDLVLELKLPELDDDEDDLSIPIETTVAPAGMEPIKLEGAEAAADERARRETAPQTPRAGENPRPETAAESPRPLKAIPSSTTAVRTSGPTNAAPIGTMPRTPGMPKPTPSGSWNRLLATKAGSNASTPSNSNASATERPVKETLPLRALSLVPPATPAPQVVPAVQFPDDDEPEVGRSLSFVPEPVMKRLMMIKRAWLVASAMLLGIAVIAFIVVMTRSSAKHAPAATPSEDVAPRLIETQHAAPVVAPKAPAAAAPSSASSEITAPKPETVAPATPAPKPTKKAPAKKWDPDALFPN
jgi:serine/threonine protein kinase